MNVSPKPTPKPREEPKKGRKDGFNEHKIAVWWKSSAKPFRRLKDFFDKHKRIILLYTYITAAALTFLLNLIVTIVLSLRFNNSEISGGYRPNPYLFRGDCSSAYKRNTGLHVAINAISTVLLYCSKSSMQILLAPTRDEIDKAHHAKRWLDVGIPSRRNFKHASRGKKLAWTLLAVSSLPLHLLQVHRSCLTRPTH